MGDTKQEILNSMCDLIKVRKPMKWSMNQKKTKYM